MDLVLTMAVFVVSLAGCAFFTYLAIERITRPKRRPFDWRQRQR